MCQGVRYSIGDTHPSYAREKTSFIKGGGGGVGGATLTPNKSMHAEINVASF